jgi:hypothetical protein
MGKKRKRNHTTTKNTMAKPPVTRLAEISGDVNGAFTIVTDYETSKVFDSLYREWFDHPKTFMWCVESLIIYIKHKRPNSICVLKEDFLNITKGKMIHATNEVFESENY